MPSSLLAFPWAEIWPDPSPLPSAASPLWRYLECPEPVSLGEGGTPLLAVANLLIKDEGRNPHGSFQDRVASLVLTAAKTAGWQRIGYFGDNAALASSLAAYAAYAGIEAEVALDPSAGEIDYLRIRAAGGKLQPSNNPSGAENAITPADLAQAARLAARTVAFEIAEQLSSESPELLLLPSASAQEVRDYEEAFAFLHDQGRISSLPQCVAVSAAESASHADSGSGIQVGFQIGEEQLRRSLGKLARSGCLLSPEGAAAAACEQHFAPGNGKTANGKTVILNPRSALVFAPEISSLLRIRRYPGRMPVGGIICPQ
jgi:threonine synthase